MKGCASLQVYCEWSRKIIEILHAFYFLLLFMWSSLHLPYSSNTFFFFFSVFPSTGGIYFASLHVIVPVINSPPGKAKFWLQERGSDWSSRNWPSLKQMPTLFWLSVIKEDQCSNTIGSSVPVQVGVSLRYTLPFFSQSKRFDISVHTGF